MIFRNCAGGVVFYANQVFLLKNEKSEWVLPKGKIRNDDTSIDAALSRVKVETGIDAEILSTAGDTCYEFFSISRKQPVCNQITWYIMKATNKDFEINNKLGFKGGGFYPIDEALDIITYSQDQSLVSLSYRKYKEIMKEKKEKLAV
ncbi:NUDIX hydrolase [Clostridium formicaceticum]|uniref:Diadenosine hexaphosphate hydrolase n=1 Tax=Clostridium formicaceticum TaxID=1497 RepID=A0AAC9RL23_9CLOT|nr:NUDIX hydrolase [Clostridium formicaceticum]AOY76818.1 NUDIX hydrolase [Clostridium formicaceticum]ARE87288.1 Diadenosine hexaphosphate hydrolase [Clostridium formicaceticum]